MPSALDTGRLTVWHTSYWELPSTAWDRWPTRMRPAGYEIRTLKIVSVSSRSRASAQRLVDKLALNCPVGDSFDEVLGGPAGEDRQPQRPEPGPRPAGHCGRRAGKHVLVEKPMAMTMDENRAIRDAVAQPVSRASSASCSAGIRCSRRSRRCCAGGAHRPAALYRSRLLARPGPVVHGLGLGPHRPDGRQCQPAGRVPCPGRPALACGPRGGRGVRHVQQQERPLRIRRQRGGHR